MRVGQRLPLVLRGRRAALTVVGIAVSAGRDRSWVAQPTAGRPRARQRALRPRARAAARRPRRERRLRRRRCAAATSPTSSTPTTGRDDRQEVTDRTSTTTVILGTSSLAALLAVGFIIANAIGGRILASRRDIGLLKAAGFTPGGVTALFVVENLLVAGAACVVGTALGIALSPLLLEPTASLLGTATPSGLRLVTVAAGVLGVVAVVCLFTALPAWRAGRLGVLEAIALGRTSVSAKPSRAAARGDARCTCRPQSSSASRTRSPAARARR